MTETKLLEIINNNILMVNSQLKYRIQQLHKDSNFTTALLDEYDLIQNKKSKLTKSQRDQVVGFVGMCMIQMVKNGD
jgi:hypothetical protein